MWIKNNFWKLMIICAIIITSMVITVQTVRSQNKPDPVARCKPAIAGYALCYSKFTDPQVPQWRIQFKEGYVMLRGPVVYFGARNVIGVSMILRGAEYPVSEKDLITSGIELMVPAPVTLEASGRVPYVGRYTVLKSVRCGAFYGRRDGALAC
jgi:hypothetical protein